MVGHALTIVASYYLGGCSTTYWQELKPTMATPSARWFGKVLLQTQAQVVDVNIMFHVLLRGKGKEVLIEEIATLTLTMGQEGDIAMPWSSMVHVNVVFLVLPRGKGKEVLAKELATLTLTMGQKGDTCTRWIGQHEGKLGQ